MNVIAWRFIILISALVVMMIVSAGYVLYFVYQRNKYYKDYLKRKRVSQNQNENMKSTKENHGK